MDQSIGNGRFYRALVPACRERDISRSVAFELKRNGFLECFSIGRRTYVYIDSLDTLPQRLRDRQAATRATEPGGIAA
jgi:hypothetical protein